MTRVCMTWGLPARLLRASGFTHLCVIAHHGVLERDIGLRGWGGKQQSGKHYSIPLTINLDLYRTKYLMCNAD